MDNNNNMPEQVAKAFLENHPELSRMSDGNYQTDEHDQHMDAHSVDLLPGVEQEDRDKNPYYVVTVSKDLVANDGTIIPKVVKIEVDENNNVKNVLESK